MGMKLPKDLERKVLDLAGGGGRKRPPRRPAKKLAAGWAVELALPCVVVSELNRRDHWAVRKRRFDVHRDTFRAVLAEAGLAEWWPLMPVAVTLTRVGRQPMDAHDGLRSAFKGLVDAVADWLGLDDGDERVEWRYAQEAGTPGVRLRIEGA